MIAVLTAQNTTWGDIAFAVIMAVGITATVVLGRRGSRR